MWMLWGMGNYFTHVTGSGQQLVPGTSTQKEANSDINWFVNSIYIRININYDQTVSMEGLWKATCLAWVQPVEQTTITLWNSLSSTSGPNCQAAGALVWERGNHAGQLHCHDNLAGVRSFKIGALDSHKARQWPPWPIFSFHNWEKRRPREVKFLAHNNTVSGRVRTRYQFSRI